MTFHEAGVAILERAGQPLSYQEITALAVKDGLLSHVGQIPEQTMRQRLVALARRSRNRRVLVVAAGQFALTDWGLPEDAAALAVLDAPEVFDEGAPRRGRERHPGLTQGRGMRFEARELDGHLGRDRKRRKKRLPPLAEVAFEILSEASGQLSLDVLLASARERDLVGDELAAEAFGAAMAEDNRRRTEAGRRPIFSISDAGLAELIEGAAGTPVEREEGERDARRISPSTQRPLSHGLESKRSAARVLRRKLAELDGAGLERVALTLLERGGYREAKVARHGREGALILARRKLGLTDLRFAIRLCPAGAEVQKEDVRELRRDLAAQGAHAGIVLGAGDASRDARAEALLLGQPLVTLLCADALAEELVLRQVGVFIVEQCVVDDPFWRALVAPGSATPRRAGPPASEVPARTDARPERRPAEVGAAGGDREVSVLAVSVSEPSPATASGPRIQTVAAQSSPSAAEPPAPTEGGDGASEPE